MCMNPVQSTLRGKKIETVQTKEEMYRLYYQGAFGNKLLTWSSYEDLLKSKYVGTVSMRYKGKAGGGRSAYNVKIENIPEEMASWISQGAESNLIQFNESAPDERLIFQGEIMRDLNFYHLMYSFEKTKMNVAMRNNPLTAKGLKVVTILKEYLSPNSYEDLMLLLDKYPNSVIEFSVYEMDLGCVPHRNTIIWECRNY